MKMINFFSQKQKNPIKFKKMTLGNRNLISLCKKYKSIPEIVNNYSDWKKNFQKKLKNFDSQYRKKCLKIIKKMNSPHFGSSYFKNSSDYIIEIENATKWFSNEVEKKFTQILYDINLKISEGEFVIILGSSGSGKTTLLNIISGIERVSNGHLVVSNHQLSTMREYELTRFRKKYLSFIFQNYSLIPELTVYENILQGQGLQEDVLRRIDIDELINHLGISEHIHKYPSQLSGGQQQRVAIAKATAKNPKILFADEPTGAVDEQTCKDILNIFWEINKKYKTTIIFITHNPIIAKIGTRVIHISKGRIISEKYQTPIPVEKLKWSYSLND